MLRKSLFALCSITFSVVNKTLKVNMAIALNCDNDWMVISKAWKAFGLTAIGKSHIAHIVLSSLAKHISKQRDVFYHHQLNKWPLVRSIINKRGWCIIVLFILIFTTIWKLKGEHDTSMETWCTDFEHITSEKFLFTDIISFNTSWRTQNNFVQVFFGVFHFFYIFFTLING